MLIITELRMSEHNIVEWVGSSCGKHGAYTFYKGFKLTANGETRKYLLGDFYFIRNSKDRSICIAEFQLLWHDANTDNQLASARLYFRPETIPGGRQSSHGKDELLYTDEKVVIKCKDMMNLEYEGTGWSYGVKAISELNLQEVPTPATATQHSKDTKKFRLMKRKNSKAKKMTPKERAKMIILSFSAYCRFKSLVKKLASGLVMTKMVMKAFGGIIQCSDSTWVSFSRETFHYPGLAKFDMFSHNKAPVLKGRPRIKKLSKTTASKEESKVKHNNVAVHRQPSHEADTSDDNQTDVSETSSINGHELPCPPKLVTAAIKEEPAIAHEVAPQGVIRLVKQASEAIPPVPKLVKIEPKEPDTVPYGQFRHYPQPGGTLMYTEQTSKPNVPLTLSFPSSVISNTHYRDVGQTKVSSSRMANTIQPRVSTTTQSRMLNTTQPHVTNTIQPRMTNTTQPRVTNTIQPRVTNMIQPRVTNTIQPRVPNMTQERVPVMKQTRVPITTQTRAFTTRVPIITQKRVPITIQPRVLNTTPSREPNTTQTRVGNTTQTREGNTTQTHVGNTTQPHKAEVSRQVLVEKVNNPTSVHASTHANTVLVSRAATITTNHNIQPRMSTIVPTALATQGEVTKDLGTSDMSKPGNEAISEQPVKRKRGRPPGKSRKVLKMTEVKIAPKTASPLVEGTGASPLVEVAGANPLVEGTGASPLVEVASVVVDEVQVKIEETSPSEQTMFTESSIMTDEEYSPEPQDADEREFMKNLKIYMRKRGSPIEKIPALGFRKINLFKMYEVTQALGGYDEVTHKRLWRRVYSEVGGTPSITSAATNSRRHYEKLLLPYERNIRGEEYTLYVRQSETPSPKPDGLVSPRKDQNGNVVSQNEAVPLATSQQEKLFKPAVSHVTPMNLQSKPSMPAVSHLVQKNRLKPVMSHQNDQFKSKVQRGTPLSQQNYMSSPAVTRVISLSQHDQESKPAVSYTTSTSQQNQPTTTTALPMRQQDGNLHPAVLSMSQQDRPLHPAVLPMSQQDRTLHPAVLPMSQQDRTSHPAVLSMSQQDRTLPPAVLPMSQQERTFNQAVAHTIEQRQYNKPAVTVVSHPNQQERRSVVSHSNIQQHYVASGSPAMYYSDNMAARYPTHVSFDHQSVLHGARPGVITGTGTSEQVGTPESLRHSKEAYVPEIPEYTPQSKRNGKKAYITELPEHVGISTSESIRGTSKRAYITELPEHVTTSEPLRSSKKAYITELPDDYPGMYVPQGSVRNEPRTSMSEFERTHNYISHFDHVHEYRIPRDYHVSEHFSDESRDVRKRARGNGDEILLTNVIPNKMSRTHSPIPRDEGYMFSVPVFQPSHYPHGGFELYDLPSTSFPVRASSQIFMPPHQVFPGTGHPGFSPCTPHIIATIGTDPGTLYQLPIPGYYPQELGYPMDTGIQILHSQ